MMDVRNFSAMMKDLFPAPGTRIKQWVVDLWREQEWERETCPTVGVPDHNDNTGTGCRNIGATQWRYLAHDCCYVCGDLHEATRTRAVVVAWLALKAARPKICMDRDQLSDEIASDVSLVEHPVLALMRARRP